MKMTYDEMLNGLTNYVRQSTCQDPSDMKTILDQCLKRFIEWHQEHNNVICHISPNWED